MDDVRSKIERQWMPHIVKELEDLNGGGSVAMADLDKSVGCVPPGFFVGENENGMLVVMVSAVLSEAAAADAKTYKVKKYSQLKTGMFVTTGDVDGAKAYAVTKVDRSNVEYDVITVGTSLGVAIPVGKTLHEVKAEDTVGGKGELPCKPIGVAKNEVDLTKNHANTGVTLRGSVNVANLAFGAPEVYRKVLPLILYR